MTTATELETFGLFIGGKTVDARSGKTFESQNPYTGKAWAVLADGARRTSTRPSPRPAPPSRASGAR